MKIYLSEPLPDGPAWVTDLDETLAAKPAKPARRRPLRNWQKFTLCYTPIMAGGALLLYQIGGALTAAVGLLIWLSTMLIIFVLASRAGRL